MFSLSVIAFIVLITVGFIAMISVYTPITNKYMQTLQFQPSMLPFIYIFLFYALGSSLVYLFFEHNDFIEPLTASRVFVPLLLATVIFIASMLFSNFVYTLVVVACVALTVYMQPLGDGFVYNAIPLWASRLILIVLFSVFCLFFSVMNLLPQTMLVPAIMMLVGISMLSVLSAAPVYLALCSALLIGTLSGYISINLNMVKIPFDNGSCCALAYLIANLMLMDAGEYSFSSCLIFSLIFWSELLIALWNKFALLQAGTLAENTTYAQAAQKYSMPVLMTGVTKICIVCLFIGLFQLFSVNQHSLFIVCLALLLWLNHSFLHPAGSIKLKDIHKEFVSDLKKNISDATETFKFVTTDKNTAKQKTAIKTASAGKKTTAIKNKNVAPRKKSTTKTTRKTKTSK